MSKSVRISKPVYDEANRISDEREVTIKEAIAIMAREGGYNV